MIIDNKGRQVFVSQGIGQGRWGSFRRKHPASKSMERVVTKFLPMRTSQAEAECDLVRYAEGKKGWKIV